MAQSFARLRSALTSRVGPMFYLVLEVPMRTPDPWRAASRAFDNLLRRAGRRFGKLGYYLVWEQNDHGHPHLNVILHGRALSAPELAAFLRENARACGFTPKPYCEPVQDKQALAGYLSKSSQLPTAAPPSEASGRPWRRVRVSRGFLPRALTRRPPKKRARVEVSCAEASYRMSKGLKGLTMNHDDLMNLSNQMAYDAMKQQAAQQAAERAAQAKVDLEKAEKERLSEEESAARERRKLVEAEIALAQARAEESTRADARRHQVLNLIENAEQFYTRKALDAAFMQAAQQASKKTLQAVIAHCKRTGQPLTLPAKLEIDALESAKIDEGSMVTKAELRTVLQPVVLQPVNNVVVKPADVHPTPVKVENNVAAKFDMPTLREEMRVTRDRKTGQITGSTVIVEPVEEPKK